MLSVIKTYLGINDTLQDELLTQIIADVTKRVNGYVSVDALPTQLEWVVQELVIIRYNRVGSEGLQSESEEGKSLSFKESDPFQEYVPELDRYLESQAQPSTTGRARFL